jgi:hypothetical protein
MEKIVCAKCGNTINSGARFCANCGSAYNEYQPVNALSDRQSATAGISISNTQRSIVNRWYFITLFFLIGIFVPGWVGLDGMDGGFGISFLSGFMVLVGLIVIFIYRARAKQMDKILNGEGKIALWKFSPELWIRFVETDFKEEKTEKRNLFILVAVISLIVGILLMIVIQDLLILLIILGILVLVAIPAFWAPRYRFRKLQHSKAEALITEKGVIVGKLFHLWMGLGASLDEVTLENNEDPAILSFRYSMPTRNGRDEQTARVPVPIDKLSEAQWIVNHFAGKN